MNASPARLLAEKILANLREPISGTIEEMERNELLEIESLIQAELDRNEKKHEGYLQSLRDDWKADSEERDALIAEAKREAYEEAENNMACAFRNVYDGENEHAKLCYLKMRESVAKLREKAGEPL